MENKEMAISYFREQVLRGYEEYKKNFDIEKIVGQITSIAQEIETRLKEEVRVISPDNVNNSDNNFEKKSPKKLLNILEENDFFKNKSTALRKNLDNVIDCRNWVIHTAVQEWKNKSSNYNLIFLQDIAQNLELFKANPNPFEILEGKFIKTGGYKELEDNIKNNWINPHYVDFNRKNYTLEDLTVNTVMDWVAVQVIMTKCLMNEFLDAFDNNPLSIFEWL